MLEPLDNAGTLGVVLLQFPRWVRPEKRARDCIASIRGALSKFNVAVELRDKEWFAGSMKTECLQWMKDQNIILTCVDEPQGFAGSMPTIPEIASNSAYVRLHGRLNRKFTEEITQSAKSIPLTYRQEELLELLQMIRDLKRQAKETYILLNSAGDRSPFHATRLGRLLEDGGIDEQPIQFVDQVLTYTKS